MHNCNMLYACLVRTKTSTVSMELRRVGTELQLWEFWKDFVETYTHVGRGILWRKVIYLLNKRKTFHNQNSQSYYQKTLWAIHSVCNQLGCNTSNHILFKIGSKNAYSQSVINPRYSWNGSKHTINWMVTSRTQYPLSKLENALKVLVFLIFETANETRKSLTYP